MKTKEQVYVKINSPKEAKDAKRILKALGETSFGNDYSEYSIGLYFNNNLHRWCFATSFGKLVYIEVTLKELIEIIVSEKPKEIEVPLYFGGKATVKANSEVTIRDASYGDITLSHGDVADLQNAINKLK